MNKSIVRVTRFSSVRRNIIPATIHEEEAFVSIQPLKVGNGTRRSPFKSVSPQFKRRCGDYYCLFSDDTFSTHFFLPLLGPRRNI